MKILGICGSPRKRGNTEVLLKEALRGAEEAGAKVEVLFFSKSVEVTVEKRFGGSSGDPVFLDTFDAPAIWNEYAGAFG